MLWELAIKGEKRTHFSYFFLLFFLFLQKRGKKWGGHNIKKIIIIQLLQKNSIINVQTIIKLLFKCIINTYFMKFLFVICFKSFFFFFLFRYLRESRYQLVNKITWLNWDFFFFFFWINRFELKSIRESCC